MTQTVRTRSRSEVPADPAPTISTTQELPPPPPGRWARVGRWLRSSPIPRRLAIIVPVVAVLVVGFVSARDGEGISMRAPDTESAADEAAALDEWRAAADLILAEIATTEATIDDAAAAGDEAAMVAQCQAAWARVPAWTDALLPAPDAELDREVRTELARLNQRFSSCALRA